VAVLVIVTPGPDTALTIRNTLLGGRSGGVATAFGVVTGQAVWALATSVGVAALLVASEPAFLALRFVGAAYLIYLGLQALHGAFRHRGVDASAEVTRGQLAPTAAYRQGVVSNLGNPKMAAFFPSLLPQFAPGGEASFWGLLALGLLFCALTLVWLTGYAFAVAKAGDLFRRPHIRRTIEGVTGAVLIGLGVRLATTRA
jgi:threonine/homoserine/homoserine lactone efflux protein